MNETTGGGRYYPTALSIEQNGLKCYRQMLEGADDPDILRLLYYLAEDEAGHAQLFTDIFQSLKGRPGSMPPPDEATQQELSRIMESVFICDGSSCVRRAAELKTPIEMLKFSLQFERDAMLFWVKLFSLAREDDRGLVKRLIEEEENHIREIDLMLKSRLALAAERAVECDPVARRTPRDTSPAASSMPPVTIP